MRATWLTDLHLNFLDEGALDRFVLAIEAEAPDALFVTGDTGESSDVLGFIERLARVAPVYFVLGNHDFYGSSLAEVRTRARATGHYLPARGPTPLTSRTLLVGVDGWGDARCGNLASPIRLADWHWIRDLDDLMACEAAHRAAKLARLGSLEAEQLRGQLTGIELPPELIVLTHVPPFAEACWHDGKISDPDWLPWFTCIAVGEVLLEVAQRAPATTITVLCGHTHGRGELQAAPNLIVRTGGWHPGQKDYGNPIVQATWTLG